MSIILIDSESITLDETTGLQNTGVAIPGEDNDDNDAGFATLNASFASRLFDPILSGGLGLDDTFAQNAGIAVNDFITLTDGSQIQGFVDGGGNPFNAFVVGSTDPTTGTLASFTTVDGDAIYLFVDEDSGLGDNMLIGVDATGDIVFSAFLEPDGTMWLVQMEAIDNPVTTNPDDPVDLAGLVGVAATSALDFDFDELPSGSNLFGVVGESATDPAIIVIGRDPDLNADGTFTNVSDVIHTSQGGTGATIGVNNQMFDPGDGAYFNYVNDPVANFLSGVPGGLTQTEADDADNIQYTGGRLDVSSAFAVISQTQGNSLVTMDITTFLQSTDDQGVAFTENLGLVGDPTPPNITLVRVTVGTTVFEFDSDSDPAQAGIDVSGLGTATVRVSGLDDGAKIEWVTDSLHNQVLIEGVAGKFDIGAFGISEATTVVAPVGDRIRFEDDGPAIVGSGNPTPALVVDESDFATNASADFSGLFTPNFAADGFKDTDGDNVEDADAVTYALGVSAPGANSGLVDSQSGQAVLLNLVGGVVIGTTAVGGLEVFRVTVNTDSGLVTLDQSRAVVHDDPNDNDESTSPAVLTAASLVTLTATATDGDGDSANTTVNIGDAFKFEDDGPAIGLISDGQVAFTAGQSVTNLLVAVEGADGAGVTITDFTPSITYGFGTVLGELSSDGKTVTYFQDVAGGTAGVFDDGIDTRYFTLALDDSDANAANWDYTFTVHTDPAPVSLEFNFDELPSGSNLFGVVGESATDPAIIVIGRDPDLNADGTFTNVSDVIHTSQGGTGATIGVNNQMFDPGDGAYFNYVNDPVANFLSGVPGGLTQTEADDADNIQYTGGRLDTNSAFTVISQTQGNALATMDITTFLQSTDDQGVAFTENLGLVGDPTPPNITLVRVTVGTTVFEFDSDSDPAQAGIDVSGLGTATVRVSGLDDGAKIEWVTDSPHNQALIEGVAGKFDLGAFGVSEPQPTPDAQLEFEVTITDFDGTNGDSAVDTFAIGIDGDLDGNVIVV